MSEEENRVERDTDEAVRLFEKALASVRRTPTDSKKVKEFVIDSIKAELKHVRAIRTGEADDEDETELQADLQERNLEDLYNLPSEEKNHDGRNHH